MNIHKLAIFILFVCVGFACTSSDNSIEASNTSTFGIRHDKLLSDYESVAATNSTNLPNFSAVIAFDYSLDGSNNSEFTATGVLINSEWILTAAHNFYDAEEQDNPAPVSGITVLVGNDPNNPEATYAVSQVVLHPTWLQGNQNYNHANDLCLVKLASPITTITPVSLYTETNELVGSTVWHCGFGDYSQTTGQNPDLDSKKHAIANVLDRVKGDFRTTRDTQEYLGGLLAFDFDNPSGTSNALGDTTVNTDESYLGTGTSNATALDLEGTTVTGDSGGPLFLNQNNTWKVAGILSGGASEPIDNHKDGDYGDISIYTRVSTSIDWINSVME
ncbi:S1 family peptidase [Wenyingzhuangia sp. IMCC45574]